MDQNLIWAHFQNRRPESFTQAEPRYRFLAERSRPGRVLNIGVGDGGFERIAARLGRDIHSLDPNGASLARIRPFAKGTAGRVDALPFKDEAFNTVVCSEMFEHLNDDILQLGLAEVYRVIKPGGLLLGTVPADEALADAETVCPCCGAVFHRWGHVQSFSRSRLQELLRPYGAVILERRRFVHWRSLNWKGRAAAWLRGSLRVLGSAGAGDNWYFCVRKHGKDQDARAGLS